MFWRKKEKAAEPYMGSAFDAALAWCMQEGEQITQISPDAFDLQLGPHVVHVERHPDDAWLNAYAILPNPLLGLGSTPQSRLETYRLLAKQQFRALDIIMDLLPDGRLSMRFTKLMQFQGNTHWMIFNMLSTFDYRLNKSEERVIPKEAVYFYVDGRKFLDASEALIYYFQHIRGHSIFEKNGGYTAFDTGGAICCVYHEKMPHEFLMTYGFSDFLDKSSVEVALNAQYFSCAYRKPFGKTAAYCFENGASELAISGVLTAGTEARPIFTRTLAEIYQVVLDSTERIKTNSGLVDGSQLLHSEEESIQQAALFHGELMGGSENLE